MGRRVLVTGLGTFWGGRIAQSLEAHDDVDVIVGLDRFEPQVELERTEYVRSDESYSILSRIVDAAAIDTIIHTFLVVDSTMMRPKTLHEINVIGTMNLFAAASTADSPVRDVIVKSSTMVYGATNRDPVWFSEEDSRHGPPGSPTERSLLEVEGYVRDFAADNPHVRVSLLRFSNVLGTDISTPISRSLERLLVPCITGFDPSFQFVHESDVVRAIDHVFTNRIPGLYNVAGDGLLPWSEVISLCGKRRFYLPPFGAEFVTRSLGQTGMVVPPEMLSLLRYGRGVDNRRLKRAGFSYNYTSAGAVEAFVESMRVRRLMEHEESRYTYERDVENFFRHSPAVVRQPQE